MGIVPNVGFDTWPKQGGLLGKRTEVCFRYDTTKTVMGTIVRDDHQEPWITIISLDDGRVILATECMHSPVW
jgi:hypothetical protein